ncbi:tRNA dihydrouridine synthase [Anaerotignum sp.]|uniref:tRNA dihydrouridine synthase n=1 Tax=Anaerotignum sp. TaxID=2039241 RepID=UPI002A918269|nr:tRNA-dihydrouridine synthase family protein [Anaerotignum sp.]MCI7656625.1 tRNA-dihydrouridine synthase family protein [Clostridia bacterium]MDY5414648.1 tRNA-dihydrouridine synthase family protein [Anaerotignum sp.]
MKFYYAPMEGITGYVFRDAHHACFPSVDRYYTPFISPNQNRPMSPKEKRDVLPENNRNIPLIPQILTNNATQFLQAAKVLADMGYEEVNLNLGCPSATVVTKGKGAGFLAEREKLGAFLDEVYEQTPIPVSLKTRLGMRDQMEIVELLELFRPYPVKEWILHARIREDYYKYDPRLDAFEVAAKESPFPLCYNGDIFSVEDYERICQRFPQVTSVMLGRGLMANPALVRQINGGKPCTKEEFLSFHNRICHGYEEIMSGDRNVLFKMKELWAYWESLFIGEEKRIKKIKKANSLTEYHAAVSVLLEQADFLWDIKKS